MRRSYVFSCAATVAITLLTAACSKSTAPGSPSPTPEPSGAPVANAFILPGAVNLGMNAFGDEPVVIFKGERMHWQNLDIVEHDVVADTGALPEFRATRILQPGDDQSFVMNTVGETTIHCSIHPGMVGKLIVRDPQ